MIKNFHKGEINKQICSNPNPTCLPVLTHWGRVMHICVTKLTNIGSNNGLSPGRRQAIIWTNDGIFLIWPLGTNFSEMLIGIHIFSFKKMHLKMSSGYRRPFCPGLNVLTDWTDSSICLTIIWMLKAVQAYTICYFLHKGHLWSHQSIFRSFQILQVPTQLQQSCFDTCQIWVWYVLGKLCLDNTEKLRKWVNMGN